jgi:hypothetical protein
VIQRGLPPVRDVLERVVLASKGDLVRRQVGLSALVVGSVCLALLPMNGAAKTNAPTRTAPSHAIKDKVPFLFNAHSVAEQGTQAGAKCSFVPPKLTLDPGQRAIEEDQVSVDTANCTSVWQIGTPTTLVQPAGSNYSGATENAVSASVVPAGVATGSGYEYAWLTDLPNITLTSDQSNISWAWSGGCVVGGNGSANWNWFTGWSSPYNSGVWISNTCDYSTVWSQSSFKDSFFCWPLTTYSTYAGVTVRGSWSGALAGWVNNMSYSGSCLPLFLHSQLVRKT